MRFLCFLLGSVLLHAAFLALPLSTSTGDSGRNGLEPLRVRLLDPGIRRAEAANMKTPRQPALQEHGPAGGAARVERPQPTSTTDEAASERIPLERPQALAQDRAKLAVRSPATRSPVTPKALGESKTRGKAVRTARKQARVEPKPLTPKAPKTDPLRARSGAPPAALAVPPAPVQAALRTSIAAAPAPEAPNGPGQDRGATESVAGPPGEAPGRERKSGASPGGETALARASDPERRRGPRASTGRGAGAARTPVRYARVVKPKYPRKARTEGWEGTTVLKVRVDRGGRPGLIAVDRTSGFDLLDRAAMRAMRRWEFHPARNGDRTVASWVKVPVSFQLEEDPP